MTHLCFYYTYHFLSIVNLISELTIDPLMVPGAHEPPKAVKEHVTPVPCKYKLFRKLIYYPVLQCHIRNLRAPAYHIWKSLLLAHSQDVYYMAFGGTHELRRLMCYL